jgi:transposase InsO family protein
MLQRLHASHIGFTGTLKRAQEALYYPGLSTDLKDLISRCEICARYQTESQKEPLLPHEAPPRPWAKVGIDVFTHRGQEYLITVDYLSNYFEVDRLPSKRVADITYILRQQFSRHGVPIEVFSDNAPFNSKEFLEFADRWEIKCSFSSPRYSQSNGKAENAENAVKRLLKQGPTRFSPSSTGVTPPPPS